MKRKQTDKRSWHALPPTPAGKTRYRKRHTAEEEAALCLAYQKAHAAGDREAARKAAEPLVADVYHLAHKMAALRARVSTLPFDDLLQLTMLGVMNAIRLFDPTRGARLATLVAWRIRASLSHGIKRASKPLPQSTMQPGRCGLFGVSRHDDPIDNIADPRADETHDLRIDLIPILDSLRGRELYMLTRYYGLDGDTRQTLQEIATEAGVTRERVRQIIDHARDKLIGKLHNYIEN